MRGWPFISAISLVTSVSAEGGIRFPPVDSKMAFLDSSSFVFS